NPTWEPTGAIVIRVCGQFGNSIELVKRPVKVICSGARFHIDHAPGGASVFGGKCALANSKFLYRIERHSLPNKGEIRISVLASIEHNVGGRGSLAVNRDSNSSPEWVARADISGEQHEVIRVSGQGGQLG